MKRSLMIFAALAASIIIAAPATATALDQPDQEFVRSDVAMDRQEEAMFLDPASVQTGSFITLVDGTLYSVVGTMYYPDGSVMPLADPLFVYIDDVNELDGIIDVAPVLSKDEYLLYPNQVTVWANTRSLWALQPR